MKYADYRKGCRAQKIPDVNILDQKDVINYLTIESATSDFVNPDAVKDSTAEDEATKEPAAKKRKKASKVDAGLEERAVAAPVVMDVDLDVVEGIISEEITLRDYNTILNVQSKKGVKETQFVSGKKVMNGKYQVNF